FTCKFAERIVDRLRLTEPDNSAISRHGVSLLSGGSGRLDTRLDTPPSINRRHPKSRLAQTATLECAAQVSAAAITMHSTGSWVIVARSDLTTGASSAGA